MMNTLERIALKECRLAMSDAIRKIENGMDLDKKLCVVRWHYQRMNEILSGEVDVFRVNLLVSNYCVRMMTLDAVIKGTWDRWERIAHWIGKRLYDSV